MRAKLLCKITLSQYFRQTNETVKYYGMYA